MTKELWINLPVKDLKKSKEFFNQLGFPVNPRFSNGTDMAGISVGKNIVMLFPEAALEKVMQAKISDTTKGSELIISFDAESRQEVDDIAKKVEKAGGNLFSKPAEIQGWMYGCAFTDLDGHRWNALYMDMSKMG